MSRKRLVLFVEGEGDQEAVPVLVKKVLTEINAWEYLTLDDNVFRVGGVMNLTGRNVEKWTNWLQAAAKRSNLGGVLLLLDGDAKKISTEQPQKKEMFCAANVARRLAAQAHTVGGGSVFSVACVFARQEYESWLMAGIDSLRGKRLSDGRLGICEEAPDLEHDTDLKPRDAKKWLGQQMDRGYKATTDQKPLTELVTLDSIRQTNPRSFRRFERAVQELSDALKTGEHVVTPQT
ncbi:MAG: DUF4276 family protein [Phycisphaerae bacterium]|nr:DUF4276 family protein [Phycisphaerae bacterium]